MKSVIEQISRKIINTEYNEMWIPAAVAGWIAVGDPVWLEVDAQIRFRIINLTNEICKRAVK